ncbi:translation initiation factor IF3-4 [Citrus sinensis]|uniref:Translation initiation factor IF3-4 n=1 Tax=Citrus sinensis TaxID=2711 RepID=A0ACB8P8B4_CITSI|nr:translation initiation factor IF3-4 [Citrus sinensis]
MAGLASAFHFSKTTPSLSSIESKFFGLHLCNLNHFFLISFSPSPHHHNVSITARYGGGGGPRFAGSDYSRRRQKEKDLEEEQAFDIDGIRSNTVRLIDAQQNMVGIVPKSEAIQMAEDAELDLVIVSPDADPPVVRAMDYNYNIDQHDYSVRLKAARKFLKDGDKVKVIVNLKGRENEFRNIAIELIRRFQNDVGELAIEENKKFRDRNIFIILVPNKALSQKAQEPPKKKDKQVVDEVSTGV